MNRKLSYLLSHWLNRQGYLLIPRAELIDTLLANHLQRIFQGQRIDVVLDIGANTGQYHDFLRRKVGFEGLIHSFEPNSRLVADLRARAAESDPEWRIHNCAIGNQQGDLDLHVMNSSTFSSFRYPSEAETNHFRQANRVIRTEKVQIFRLDEIADKLELLKDGRLYVKTDTQGFDLEVMRGGQQVLHVARAIQFEIPFKRIYAGMPSYQDILFEAERHAFEISAFVPVSADENLSAIEMDCVMVKKVTR